MAPRSKVPNTTIVDIAAASGVSVATVSRIINNKPDVADETRQRVLQVMEEIGFAPQNAWRQIRSGRTRLIAVHVPQEFNPPAYPLVMSAALGVEDAGYSINIITRRLSDAELLGIFRSRQADGIILLEILTEDRRPELLRDHGYPFVMVGRRADNAGLSFADVDVEHGMELAVEHLVALGHRNIGLLTIDPVVGDDTYGFATWATDGYRAACARHGLPVIRSVGGPTAQAMAEAAERLLEQHPGVTACIAPQDQSVVGLFRAVAARGMRVPADISVVAVLNESLAELATPPLTTIGFPSDDLGRTAARILLDRLDRGRQEAGQVLLTPGLVVRGSTAAPRR